MVRRKMLAYVNWPDKFIADCALVWDSVIWTLIEDVIAGIEMREHFSPGRVR